MSITITKAGVLDSVQDMGRVGFRHLGVNTGGVMDPFAASIANALVGNEEIAPLLELHFPASTILFNSPALISLAGADFSAAIDDEPIPAYTPIIINKQATLHFKKMQQGARLYLAVAGGWQVPPVLNSSSTNLQASFGGYKGRKLQSGDTIPFPPAHFPGNFFNGKKFIKLPWHANNGNAYLQNRVIHILPGNEWEILAQNSRHQLLQQPFTITNKADRMAYHLSGPVLESLSQEELLSRAVVNGTLQLLPGGKLMLLMANHQCTGGYPQVAHVVTASQHQLAQMKTGDTLHFELTTQQHAEKMILEQHRYLHQLQIACKLKLNQFLERYA